MRTIEIGALVSLRKHVRRSARVAAIEAALLPAMFAIGGVNAAAIPVAVVALLASIALFGRPHAAARFLTLLLAAFNALLLIVIAFRGTPNGEQGMYPAIVFWTGVFLFGSLEGLLASFTPSARRAAASPWVDVVLASSRRIASLFPGGPTGWLVNARTVTVLAMSGVIIVSVAIAAWLSTTFGISATGARNLVVLFTGAFAVWLRRKLARRGTEVRRRDPRPPVLLLRSFDDDMRKVGPGEKWTRVADWQRRGMTLERVITRELTAFGPVIAIGKPGESLAPLGAARDYVSDAAWQDEVAERMVAAQLMVFVVGASEGLAWELRRVHRLGLQHKLILVFPAVNDIAPRWDALRASAHDLAPADNIDPARTLALACNADRSPIALVGPHDEWSYETALRLAAVVAHSDQRLQEVFPGVKAMRAAAAAPLSPHS